MSIMCIGKLCENICPDNYNCIQMYLGMKTVLRAEFQVEIEYNEN